MLVFSNLSSRVPFGYYPSQSPILWLVSSSAAVTLSYCSCFCVSIAAAAPRPTSATALLEAVRPSLPGCRHQAWSRHELALGLASVCSYVNLCSYFRLMSASVERRKAEKAAHIRRNPAGAHETRGYDITPEPYQELRPRSRCWQWPPRLDAFVPKTATIIITTATARGSYSLRCSV